MNDAARIDVSEPEGGDFETLDCRRGDTARRNPSAREKLDEDAYNRIGELRLGSALDFNNEALMSTLEHVWTNGFRTINDLRGKSEADVFVGLRVSSSDRQLFNEAVRTFGVHL